MVDASLDSNAIELLESYFNVIAKNYLIDYNNLRFYLEPIDSAKIASNSQITSITNITRKEIIVDEEFGDIESSYNSPIFPSEILFSLKFGETLPPENYNGNYHCLWIGIEVDFIGFNYKKSETSSTLWQKTEDIFNKSENSVLNNIFETYYYHSSGNKSMKKKSLY